MNGDSSNRRLKVWSGLIIAGVFLAGFFAGAGVFTWLEPKFRPPFSGWGRHKPHPRERILEELRQLNLSPEQQKQADVIVEKRHSEIESMIKATFPRVRQAREDRDRELGAILTPEQAKKFDEIIRTRRPERWGGPPGGFARPGEGAPPSSRPPDDAPRKNEK